LGVQTVNLGVKAPELSGDPGVEPLHLASDPRVHRANSRVHRAEAGVQRADPGFQPVHGRAQVVKPLQDEPGRPDRLAPEAVAPRGRVLTLVHGRSVPEYGKHRQGR
jgi:hypothetical protein